MVQYSSLFSSGLMAPRAHNYRAYSPEPSSSAATTNPTISETSQFESQKPPKIQINTQMTPSRQKLRRRRSSLTMATSPISAIKSPSKSASISFTRALLMSPGKSGGLYDLDEDSQNYGRRISDLNLGKAMRSRRGTIRKAAPPAPLGPLPAIPDHPPSSPTRPDYDFAPQTAPPDMTHTSLPFGHDQMSHPTLHNILTNVSLNEAQSQNHSESIQDSTMLLSPDFSNMIYSALTTPPGSATFEHPSAFPWKSYAEDNARIDEDII